MANNNVQTTVTVGMDVQLAKRNAEALKQVISDLRSQLKLAREAMDSAANVEAFKKAGEAVDNLILKIKTLEKVQKSATPASAYEAFISGDAMNSNTLRQAQRGAKNRLNTVRTGEGDAEARKFIQDTNAIQKQLNRLQAGFTSPFRTIKQELKSLSGGELQRLHQLLQQEQPLVKGNEKAWANYSEAIAKVEERMREYDTAARQKAGAATLSKSQSGGFAAANERDINRAIEKLREYRAVINDPNGSGKATWEATTREILKLQATLDGLKAKADEASGKAMSLGNALNIGTQAAKGTFTGSTKNLALAKKTLQEQLELVERNSTEYKQLQKVIQGVEMEEKRMGMTAKEVKSVLDSPKGKSFNELKIAVEHGRMELARMRTDTKEGKKAFDELAAKVKEADAQMKQLGSSSKGSASAFEKAWSRLKTYVGLYVGAAVEMQKIAGTMGDLMELSDKMGEVRKTTGFTADEVGRLTENLKRLDVRSSITDLLDLSAAAGQMGLKTQESIEGFTKAANMLTIALPEMGRQSAVSLMKIANATGDLGKNGGNVEATLQRVGSTIIALRANSASAAPAITDFVSRIGAVGAQAGISIDQIAALGSTIDALGGRVEMSATALSRMIPAIRNNAFGVANAIGVTEKTLTDLFNQGRAMEAMVLIFRKMRESVQQFDTSTEEGMNAMANNVEDLLGKNASMAEVMKELNQQGARAGIVFGLLSQNVDELEKQLNTAGQAYRANTALLNEFNNMNETTAAKWARLKNQLEEFFVGDRSQRWLGTIIDWLRKIVDLITEDGPIGSFFRYTLLYLTLMKAKWAEAFGGALISMGKWLLSLTASTAATTADTAAKTANAAATTAVGDASAEAAVKTNIFAKAWGKMSDAMKANVVTAVAMALWALGSALLDARQKAIDAAAAIARVKEKTDEEREAVSKLFTPLKNANIQQEEKNRLIAEINRQYGSYLSKMLTEASNAQEIAHAYQAINLQLQRKNTLEGMEANRKKILDERKDELDSAFGELDKFIMSGSVNRREGAQLSADITDIIKNSIEEGLSKAEVRKQITELLQGKAAGGVLNEKTLVSGQGRADWVNTQKLLQGSAMEYYDTQLKVQKEVNESNKRLQADLDNTIGKIRKAADKDIPELIADFHKALSKGNDASKYTAKESQAVVEAFDAIKAYYDLHHDELSDEQKNRINANLDGGVAEFRTKAGSVGGGGSANPYGSFDRVTSDYGKWDADSLVKRRKEMLERVRALANGADVQAVLSEDAKFISEATRKNIKTTRDAIEWYNTERLKIQESLHERHLTNTGDWMDPKKQKARKKLFETDLRAYLEELDAYYTERKTRIQEAGNEEGITEAEVRNRTLANEVEWRQRRAELQKLYADKSKEVTEDEQQAIYDIIAERTGDEASFIEKTLKKTVDFSHKVRDMNEQGAKEYRKWMADLGLGWERDLNKQARAVAQQMKAIQDIIDKERPFNGITKNLRENLVTMGILTADMTRERDRLMREGLDMADFNARQAAEELKRTTFMLGEAENAYTTTIEDVMRHMADAGMTAWADELRRNPKMQEGMIAQLHSTYDAIQEAIKKEASLWKKEAEIMWNNILMPDGKNTLKQTADRVMAQLGLDAGRVQRANSLIGAGQASERVADRLAIKQMQIQLTMQEHYYNLMRKRGQAMVDDLKRQAEAAKQRGDIEEATRKTLDAQHAQMALNLATAKEETELAKQREDIIARTEESQKRLYMELKSWGDLIASSLQSVFEASHAGDAEYYNELAKLNLTGKGGPGAGTYVVIDNAGTSGATAHYEHLSELEALERHHEIERQNAQAEAWKKVMDDINMKMSETITDQMNAMLQNTSVDANTDALIQNTAAIAGLTSAMGGGDGGNVPEGSSIPTEPANWMLENEGVPSTSDAQVKMAADDAYTQNAIENAGKRKKAERDSNQEMTSSAQSAFAKMTQAANLYGIAYQAMSNDNMSASQKFGMIAIQAAGNAAITTLTTDMSQAIGESAVNSASVWGKLWNQLGWWAIPVYALFTGTLGGLMGLAASKIAKSKSEIASVTGASNSVASGRLTTGMHTYAEGNVNEFTDPATLTPGRQYNVDGDDGKTYRARYMGKDAKTHITNGPEFHLVGEAGREAIIDAHTTRNIQMNEPEVWRAIQTLYNGGSLRHSTRRRGRGMAAYADGNIDDFEDMGAMGDMVGTSAADMEAMRQSLDRNSAIQEALLERLSRPIQAKFDVYGKGGLVDSYDTGKKTVDRYGQRF